MAHGNVPFRPHTPHCERGLIFDVDATRHAYEVVTNSGRRLTGVGRFRRSPSDVELLPLHTPVVIDWSIGQPYISHILPAEVAEGNPDESDRVTETRDHGGDDPLLNRNMQANFRAPEEPRDLLPGDHVTRGPDGAMLAAMHGKLAVVRGSPLAQLRMFGNDDHVELIAGTLRQVTWMGESKIESKDGKTSFIWRGGSDQSTHNGPDEDHYTIRLDVGDSGGVFNFEVTTPQGQPLFRFHVSEQGRLTINARGGTIHGIGGEDTSHNVRQVHGNETDEITGSLSTRIRGDVTLDVDGSRDVVIGDDQQTRIGRDRHVYVGENDDLVVVGVHRRNIKGNDTLAILEGNKRTELRQGNYNVDLVRGNAGFTLAAGNFETEVRAGQWRVRAPSGAATIASPDIKLGALAGRTPTDHATKFEDLERELQRMNADLNTMRIQLLGHGHPSFGAPSPQLSGLIPFTLVLTPARSLTVTLL